MKIVTHDSRYHTDDVFAVATLLLALGECEVVRSRDPEVQATADYIVDTGMAYDPEKHIFDHHQPGGAGVRPNGIPYASFGLVWKEFGESISGSREVADIIEQKLVLPVDAYDNGISTATYIFEGVREYTISDFFNSLIESRTQDGFYKAFMTSVEIAKGIITREIKIANKFLKDKEVILGHYNKSEDKRIIVMLEDLSGWKEVLRQKPEVLYVIYPRPDGKWGVDTIQDEKFITRKNLPSAWGGLRDEELQKITGVSDALFCHRALFMAAAKTKEGAIKLAQIALNS